MSDHPQRISVVGDNDRTNPGSVTGISRELARIRSVVQSQGETQLAIYSAVKALDQKVDRLEAVVRARIPPGFLWLIGLCAVLITAAVLWSVFGPPLEASSRVRESSTEHNHDRYCKQESISSHRAPALDVRTRAWAIYEMDHTLAMRAGSV